jgi:hypothetical protein
MTVFPPVCLGGQGCPGAALDRTSCNRLQAAVQRFLPDIMNLSKPSPIHGDLRKLPITLKNKEFKAVLALWAVGWPHAMTRQWMLRCNMYNRLH